MPKEGWQLLLYDFGKEKEESRWTDGRYRLAVVGVLFTVAAEDTEAIQKLITNNVDVFDYYLTLTVTDRIVSGLS